MEGMDLQEAGSSWIDGVDSESFGMNGMSGVDLEHLQKLQKESSFDRMLSYERIFKTLWPVIPKEQKSPFPPLGSCPIAKKLMGAKLEYGDHISEMVSESKKLSPIKIGQSFDVISFLSGNGDMNHLFRNDGKTERVEVGKQTFSGKYIWVCCFHLPVFCQEFNGRRAQAIATACSELYSSRSDFEMVVVAKMNQLANHEVLFKHFMSGFPPSCLVAPFQHSKRRDFICKYLDLVASECDDIKCLILDKDTDIKRNILYCGYPDFALDHGAESFPFTGEKLQEVSADDRVWEDEDDDDDDILPCKLEDLLRCSPSDVLCKTVSPGVHEKVTILELSSKVVWVYACVGGQLIPTIGKVYQQCRAQGLGFEIVRRHGYPVMADEDDLRRSESVPYWYVCPFDPRHSTSLEEQLSKGCLKRNAIVAFGTDGRVCSLGSLSFFFMMGPKDFRFDDKSNLRGQVLYHLRSQGGGMMCAALEKSYGLLLI